MPETEEVTILPYCLASQAFFTLLSQNSYLAERTLCLLHCGYFFFRYTLQLSLPMNVEPNIWKLVQCDEADHAVCFANRGLYSDREQ